MPHLTLHVQGADGHVIGTSVEVCQVLLAGYTGRDRRAVMAHVRELEALGVAPPHRIPSVFVVNPWSVRVADVIEASGPETSGEVEVVLIRGGEGLLVGVGSDHTDRAWEAVDIDEAKRRCPKPVGSVFWRHEDVAEHWDELELRSWMTDGIGRRLYQEGALAELLPVDELFDELRGIGVEPGRGTVVFGGSLATLGGVRFGQRFDVELRDPVLGRSIAWGYRVAVP